MKDMLVSIFPKFGAANQTLRQSTPAVTFGSTNNAQEGDKVELSSKAKMTVGIKEKLNRVFRSHLGYEYKVGDILSFFSQHAQSCDKGTGTESWEREDSSGDTFYYGNSYELFLDKFLGIRGISKSPDIEKQQKELLDLLVDLGAFKLTGTDPEEPWIGSTMTKRGHQLAERWNKEFAKTVKKDPEVKEFLNGELTTSGGKKVNVSKVFSALASKVGEVDWKEGPEDYPTAGDEYYASKYLYILDKDFDLPIYPLSVDGQPKNPDALKFIEKAGKLGLFFIPGYDPEDGDEKWSFISLSPKGRAAAK